MSDPESSGRGDPSLRDLLAEVLRTRQIQLEEQRGASAQTLLPVRRASLQALENYTVALHQRGWPTPPRMSRDIQLLRALCGVNWSRGLT